MRQLIALAIALMSGVAIGVVTGYGLKEFFSTNNAFFSPLIAEEEVKQYPLQQYSIENLAERVFESSQIVVEKEIKRTDQSNKYRELQFSFTTMGKKMTGQLTLPPASAPTPKKAIVMIRGFVPAEIYTTGTGTRPAARVFAEHGYAVFAPDFFGYGESDPEPSNSWETRFVKPINVAELLLSIEKFGVEDNRAQLQQEEISALQTVKIPPIPQEKIGIWAHSNGGQVALTTLEILAEPIPTTLWAPVTAPFPYSVLFFSDELEDEGKEQRAWIAIFEKDYDVFDFSLTQHLNRLTGPLQIHHGTDDEAALKTWSDEFIDKIKAENTKRGGSNDTEKQMGKDEISYKYFIYPGADHNLRPTSTWNQAITRDLQFFDQKLK